MLPAPAPGVYRGIPAETYHRWDCANKTTLWAMHTKSAAHALYERENPKEPTKAMEMGTALHHLLLEQDTFADSHAIALDYDRRTKLGKAAWAAFKEMAGDRKIITEEDRELLGFMAKSILSHDVAGKMLSAGGDTEVSIVWDDEDTGVRCKARIDWMTELGCVLADLKKVAGRADRCNIGKSEFSKIIANMGYHMQGAFYLDGASAAFEDDYTDFIFLIVEDSAPYLAAARALTPEATEAGRTLYKKMLVKYVNCKKNDYWPGFTGLEDADIPAWAMPKD